MNVAASIAASTETSYALRIQAALATAGVREPSARTLGGAELDLIASGAGALSAGAANQPFFYQARLLAAQSSNEPRIKFQLLGNALADTPTRDDVGTFIFIRRSVKSDQFARGVIEPLLRQQIPDRVPFAAIPGDENFSSESDNTANEGTPVWLPAALKLAPAQQSQVASTLAEVLVRTDHLNDALSYLQIAQRLEKTSLRRQQIAGKIADIRAQLRRQQLNEARQPILHEALEQDRTVRPKLLARAVPVAKATSPKTAEKKGVTQ